MTLEINSRVEGFMLGELDMLKNGINSMAMSLAAYHEEMQHVLTILRIGPVTSRIRRQPKISAMPIQNSIMTLEIAYCVRKLSAR
jgi:hypothetical protein